MKELCIKILLNCKLITELAPGYCSIIAHLILTGLFFGKIKTKLKCIHI